MALLANYAVAQTFFLELAASAFSVIQERLKDKSASYIPIHWVTNQNAGNIANFIMVTMVGAMVSKCD